MFPLIWLNIGDTILSQSTNELLIRLRWVSIPAMDTPHPGKRNLPLKSSEFAVCTGCIRQPAPSTLLLANVLPAASQGLPSQPHACSCPPPIKLTSVTLWLHCLLTLSANTCFVPAAIECFYWHSEQGCVHFVHILARTLWV